MTVRIAFAADERTHLTDALIDALRLRGHDVDVIGPAAGEEGGWADVAREVGERVVLGRADQGVICCWTGTGVSIAANKVPGVRAALCADAETARMARKYNHANVLALSLRATSPPMGREIVAAFLDEPDGDDDFDRRNVAELRGMEAG